MCGNFSKYVLIRKLRRQQLFDQRDEEDGDTTRRSHYNADGSSDEWLYSADEVESEVDSEHPIVKIEPTDSSVESGSDGLVVLLPENSQHEAWEENKEKWIEVCQK